METPIFGIVTTNRFHRRCLASAAAGMAMWLAWLVLMHPQPMQRNWPPTLLLISPLILVPLGLRLATGEGEPDAVWKIALRLQLPASLLLILSFVTDPGATAAGFAIPWFITTLIIALYGLRRAWSHRFFPLEELSLDAGLMLLPIGGLWLLFSRFGYRPLNFDPTIVILTAVHFHFAGFALPILTGLAGRRQPGIVSRIAAAGVILGVPLVAAGITARRLGASLLLEAVATSATAAAALLTAFLHFRLAARPDIPLRVRFLWLVAATSLAGGMLLAITYGLRSFIPVPWLSIPWMQTLHGTADAVGFGFVGLLAWNLLPEPDSSNPQ